jgi:hypothetical protein
MATENHPTALRSSRVGVPISESVTPDHQSPENARTGTSALGSGPGTGALHDGGGASRLVARAAAAAELVVVDTITEHDVEPDKKFAGERDFCLGSAASMQDGEVARSKIIIGASREERGLTEDPAEECAALLSDLAEVVFVGRRVNGGRQADVAHDMFAVQGSARSARGQGPW